MKINYAKLMEATIEKNSKEGIVPRLLLHSCCAPCSSHVIEYLSRHFHITVLYYNPNITDAQEYAKRVAEQKKFIEDFPAVHPVGFLEGDYDPQAFFSFAKDYALEPEKGRRCELCYAFRLEETAKVAKKRGFDYFTTTLSISPLKDSQKINEIGARLENALGVSFLYSDFKKKEGYKRSIELSRIYGLYRQDYCGCIYSKENGK